MKKIILIIVVLGCGFWFYYLMYNYDFSKSSYTKYDEIDFKKGWIPKWIPKSSFNINEFHNIDTNELLISFKCKDIKTNLSNCKKIVVKNPLFKTASLSKFSTTIKNILHELKEKKYEYFLCEYDKNYIWAVDEKSNQVYIFEK